MTRFLFALISLLSGVLRLSDAFVAPAAQLLVRSVSDDGGRSTASVAVAVAMTTAATRASMRPRTGLFMSEDFIQETSEATRERIEALVENHPVLLFMKGSKLFPQCGFSNTAVQILQSYGIDFHTVDVLSDEAIRSGVKQFSQWPTIPQLYVAGEFIGGSDIMIELYQTGELGEMIEKAKADMV